MRFRKGEHYPHPPRGPSRGRYHMSDAARRARRQSLSKSRLRSDSETRVIKLLIWQSCIDDCPRPWQRALAHQLGVYPSYVCKVQKQSDMGLEMLSLGQRVTFDDLEKARRATAQREQDPRLVPAVQSSRSEKSGAMTDDEVIAKNWLEVNEWKGKHSGYGKRGWFRW